MTTAQEHQKAVVCRPEGCVGGQALIEGVLMRSPTSIAAVCRRRDGALVVRRGRLRAPTSGLRSWLFLRGVFGVASALRLGSRALRWSAEVYDQGATAGTGDVPAPAKKSALGNALHSLALGVCALIVRADEPDDGSAEDLFADRPAPAASIAKFIPLAMALVLFVALPQGLAELVNYLVGLDLAITSMPYQAITGVAQLAVLVGYVSLLRKIPEVRRVFEYHGAEHKTVSAYEAGAPLDVENARPKTTLHARCGTTFLVTIAILSVFAFAVCGALLPPLGLGRFADSVVFFFVKLPLLPLVASVSYELQRFLAKTCTSGFRRVFLLPGFAVQRITTIEPDDRQLEIALSSLQLTESNSRVPMGRETVFPSFDRIPQSSSR